jgi:hypothetical protein
LMILLMLRKADSTLVAFLADVSRKGIPSSSAKAWGQVVLCGAHLGYRVVYDLL